MGVEGVPSMSDISTRRSDSKPADFVSWHGGACPVGPNDLVEIWLRGNHSPNVGRPELASNFSWHHNQQPNDIKAYRVVAKPPTFEQGMAMASASLAGLKERVAESRLHERYPHYHKRCGFESVDVYRVLTMFEVTDPCIQHAVKKLLVAGQRGAKDINKDITEAIATLQRWQDMRVEEITDK